MFRILIRIAAALVAVGVILIPALVFLDDSDGDTGQVDPVTITQYTSEITVDKAGELTVIETITGDFPPDRHGLFRYWDLSDPQDPAIRFIPKDIEITMDGAQVPVSMSWDQGKQFRVAKIGDPDQTLAEGKHTFEISYRVPGAISPEGEGSRFEWQPIAAGWSNRIDSADITVTLPHTPTDTVCRLGRDSKCNQFTTNGKIITISASDLAPNTPVRVAAVFAQEASSQKTVPWPIAFDGVLGHSVVLVTLLSLLAAAAAAGAHILERRTREDNPGFPVMFEPPEGLGPVQTYYVTHETVGSHALASTMMYLAEQGVIALDRSGRNTWTITSNWDAARWGTLNEVGQQFGSSLGLQSVGSTFSADGSVSAGEKLGSADLGMTTAAKAWGRSTGLVMSSTREWAYRGVIAVAAIAAGLIVFILPIPSIWAAPFAAAVVGGIGVFAKGVGTRRTPAGRDVWSRAGGFERFLTTPSAEDRFLFAERKDLFTEYIPYAVAFNVADAWAARYQTAMGSEPESPSWLPVGTGMAAGHALSSSISSFDSALTSSISAYQATQSSSGGGGGFSGGGGGGGGGGSW